MPNPSHIALAHDWLVGLRGGERVLDRLARLLGPADLYTLVNDERFLTDAIARCNIITSPLQHFPGAAGRWRRQYLPLMPWAVGQIKVKPCDLLVSTSSAVMKSINPPPGVPHLCYCHSPARYIWEQTDDYAQGAGGGLRSLGLRAVRRRFQNWDRRTAARVTKFLANSAHTATRIKRCFDREAEVVYPPVRTEFFTMDPPHSLPSAGERKKLGARGGREDWLLVVSALEPYKRTDVVIEAANRAAMPLKVVGDGSQGAALRKMAGPTVQMLGRVPDEQLRDCYRRAKALVFPQIEDFGIIAVEAQACGCPVVAYAAGGAREIVTDETGVLFAAQTPEAVLQALEELKGKAIDPQACVRSAQRFSEAVFDDAMRRQVDLMLAPRPPR